MGQLTPKFMAQCADEAPISAEVPELNMCKVNGGRIEIPAEIRSQYMNDPIRAVEWRQIVATFDKMWGPVEAGSETPAQAVNVEEEQEAATPTGGSIWAEAFVGEPNTTAEFEAKYKPLHSFPINDAFAGVVVEGPKLFIQALADGEWGMTEPILCYGAGSWLLDQKADVFLRDWSVCFVHLSETPRLAGELSQGLCVLLGIR